jgi:hypothetical protein
MTEVGPTDQRPPSPQEAAASPGESGTPPAVSPAMQRAGRLTAANMLRSMGPLVVICLVIVGWTTLRQTPEDPVREVDPSNSVSLAAARADYPLLVPQGLDDDYRPTSARTDAGDAGEGDAVTLEIGYLTPEHEFAGFVVSDDLRSAPLATVLDGAEEHGTVDVGGQSWTRSTTDDGETALSREIDGVTVLVSGSASEEELETVAAAVSPYSG